MVEGTSAIPELEEGGLRNFGLTMAGAIAAVFGILLPSIFDFAVSPWPFLIALALLGWSVAAPKTLRFIYRPWMMLGLALNRITTPIIMGTIFFLLITPVSLVMKLISRDPLAREFDPQAKSYRKQSRKPPRESLERPF